jgi:hypothetical protein
MRGSTSRRMLLSRDALKLVLALVAVAIGVGSMLSAERYRWDGGADLVPVDLALGWGPMSDSAMLERFEVTQGARFYTLYPQDEAADLGVALRHSANMHLIPASEAVRRTLESAAQR